MPGTILLEMKVNGYTCQVEGDITSGIARSVVEHLPLGYHGPILEDMGLEGHSLKFPTLWEGENYPKHVEFLKNYSSGERGLNPISSIQHPEYGLLYGLIRRLDVRHVSDERMAVHIDIDFIQSGEPVFTQNITSLLAEVQDAAQGVYDDTAMKVSDKVKNLSPIDVEQVLSAVNSVESMAMTGQTALDHFSHDLEFALNTPARIVAGAFKICAALEESKERILDAPRSAIAAFRANMAVMSELFGAMDPTGALRDSLSAATGISVCRMGAIAIDSFKSTAVGSGGSSASSGRATSATNSAGATRDDIDGVIWHIRDAVKPAIEKDRGGTPELARLVRVLTERGTIALEASGGERIVNVPVDSSIFVILLQYHVNRNKADAVCRRNGIENPNRVRGTIAIPMEDWV